MTFSLKNTFRRSHGNPERLCLVRAKDATDHRAWYFLQLNPLTVPQFDKAVALGHSFNLEHYGDIVASGYGEEIPEKILEQMRREYGWNG